MKRGFTLIELLVVVGIMSFLGVAATGGYSALQRGMAARSAVAAVSSLLKAAKERALVDRSPTVVFCYNRLLNEKTETENAVVVGEAVAVRRAGRVSWTSGTYIADEFMDVVGSYDIVADGDVSKRKGMKLWWFGDQRITEMKYSIVADAVWCDGTMLETIFSGGTAEGSTNVLMSAFYNLKTSKNEASWKVGDAYAFEIGEISLPNGFIFGSNIPTEVGTDKLVQVMLFDPESETDESIEVWSTKPTASGAPAKFKQAGTATSDEAKSM